MATPLNRFVVPSLTNSDFCDGKIYWELLKSVSSWVRQGQSIDVVDFGRVLHLKPYAVALSVAAVKRLGIDGLDVVPPTDFTARDHLIRLGVPKAIGANWGSIELRASNVPLEILTERPSSGFSFKVASMLADEFSNGLAPGLTSRIADSIDEVILNALAHSESSIGCIVVGQAFPVNHCIEVAMVDLGITIRGHLGRRFPNLVTDGQAIQEAVKEGVTGTPPGCVNSLGDPNSGVGLAELKEFVENTGGELAILSGSAIVCFGPKAVTHSLIGQPFPGTLVNVKFNTSPGAAPPRTVKSIYY